MKKHTLSVDFLELLDLQEALAEKIRSNVKLNKILGVKYGFYNHDKQLTKLYKRIVKQIKKELGR